MKLEKVVPWGRSKREYVGMFALNNDDLKKQILGCGDGPASFNAEITSTGGHVISCDPVYQFSASQILQRFDDAKEGVLSQMRSTPERWVWKYHTDLDDLYRSRRETLQRFIADFDIGKAEGRYVTAEMPQLPFANHQFGLALCSHFLFLYSDHFTEEFHVQSVLELCRVADEVRVFPILNLAQELSPHLSRVCDEVTAAGFSTEIIQVDYEQQKGGNKMLRISA